MKIGRKKRKVGKTPENRVWIVGRTEEYTQKSAAENKIAYAQWDEMSFKKDSFEKLLPILFNPFLVHGVGSSACTISPLLTSFPTITPLAQVSNKHQAPYTALHNPGVLFCLIVYVHVQNMVARCILFALIQGGICRR